MSPAGCATTKAPSEPTMAEAPATRTQAPSQSDVAPKLVVLIILDQLGSWVLEQHLPLLRSDGVIRRAYEEGAFHTVELPYASTQTAPSHASLVSGVTPAVHGIVANSVYEPGVGIRRTVDDRKHGVLGNPDRFVSPTQMRAESVADVLRSSDGGDASVVVGISMKARSAALSAGQRPDIAVFYDAEARGMTTSSYYAPRRRLPAWLGDFNKANPVEPLLQAWEPADAVKLERRFGPDARAGEMFPAFPHDPREAPEPWKAFLSTPESSEYLIAAAYAVVKAERMGLDEAPDFLALSVSGTDTVGHVWGPLSWEYADNLARVDRALTQFASLLEERGPVSFVLTADHGVATLPEQAHADGERGGRLNARALRDAAERAADEALGEGDWIEAYAAPLFTYTKAGKARHEELSNALRKAMPAIEGVSAVYDAREGAALRASGKEVERLVGENLPDDPPGDLYLVTDPGWFDELSKAGGTNHGTPWEYDRSVPVLMWGAAIERRTSRKAQNALRVAATLAALLNVPPPKDAPPTPLPGVMRLPD